MSPRSCKETDTDCVFCRSQLFPVLPMYCTGFDDFMRVEKPFSVGYPFSRRISSRTPGHHQHGVASPAEKRSKTTLESVVLTSMSCPASELSRPKEAVSSRLLVSSENFIHQVSFVTTTAKVCER